MVLWRNGGNLNAKEYSIVVAPGAFFPDVSDFMDPCGKPVQFNIVFKYGKTDDLPSNLAAYLITAGYAKETRIALA